MNPPVQLEEDEVCSCREVVCEESSTSVKGLDDDRILSDKSSCFVRSSSSCSRRSLTSCPSSWLGRRCLPSVTDATTRARAPRARRVGIEVAMVDFDFCVEFVVVERRSSLARVFSRVASRIARDPSLLRVFRVSGASCCVQSFTVNSGLICSNTTTDIVLVSSTLPASVELMVNVTTT